MVTSSGRSGCSGRCLHASTLRPRAQDLFISYPKHVDFVELPAAGFVLLDQEHQSLTKLTDYLQTAEAAEYLGVHHNTLRKWAAEDDIKGLFADFDTTSNRLGNTVKDKNLRLAAV